MTDLTVHEQGYRGNATIVFLHGVGNTGAMWRDLMAALPGYHCLAPDMPGHGGSRLTLWRSRADTAERVAALIERRASGGRAHVVGLSLGGSVALELLATRPELLDHVVVDGCAALSSVVIGPMKLGVAAISPLLRFAAVARLVGRAFGVEPGSALENFVDQIQAADSRSFRRAFADANDTRITPAMLAAACPTLFVAGERELRHVRTSNRLLAELMPCALARFVPGAGHGWGASQYPELHRRLVTAWLENRSLPDGLAAEPSEVPHGRVARRAQRASDETSR
jgi:pimeloyl-ACP methyl ester carboxylesterase